MRSALNVKLSRHPEHILDCLGLSRGDIYSSTLLGPRFPKGQRSDGPSLTSSDFWRISHHLNSMSLTKYVSSWIYILWNLKNNRKCYSYFRKYNFKILQNYVNLWTEKYAHTYVYSFLHVLLTYISLSITNLKNINLYILLSYYF